MGDNIKKTQKTMKNYKGTKMGKVQAYHLYLNPWQKIDNTDFYIRTYFALCTVKCRKIRINVSDSLLFLAVSVCTYCLPRFLRSQRELILHSFWVESVKSETMQRQRSQALSSVPED